MEDAPSAIVRGPRWDRFGEIGVEIEMVMGMGRKGGR
jgi:hypothetical protein